LARLFVTGGAGFIGANFVHYWLDRHPGDRVVVLDALTYAGNLGNLGPVRNRSELRFAHADVRNTSLIENLLRDERLDTIVHFAAESHVDRSILGPDAFIETNVNGTHSLLKAARRVWLDDKAVSAHRFHHISTDEVYGSLGPNDPPFTEATAYAPNSPYSASKAASDHLVRAYHHTYGLQTTISNCSNNYGPYQFPEKLIPVTIMSLLEGRPVPVYGDGKNVRDWLHVNDHCRAIELILERGRIGEVYNIGGQCERANIDLVTELCSIVDRRLHSAAELRCRFANSPAAKQSRCDTLISYVKDRPGHDRRYAIDCSKAHRELGFKPRMTMEVGLDQVVEWYMQRLIGQPHSAGSAATA
jgi:dTDP-glucose 4,6-dehydratase